MLNNQISTNAVYNSNLEISESVCRKVYILLLKVVVVVCSIEKMNGILILYVSYSVHAKMARAFIS